MKRWVVMAALMAGGPTACDDGGTVEPAGDMQAPAPDPDMGPPEQPFNYIPLNDEACRIEDVAPGVRAVAGEALEALVTGGDHHIAANLKLCDEDPIPGCDFTCTGEQNPLLQLSRDFDGPLPDIVAEAAEFDVPQGLARFFEQALSYPYRELVVSYVECATLPAGSCPAGADVQVVLTQGRRQLCDGQAAGCDLFSIEPESLDLDCGRFPLTLYGAVEGDLGGEYALTAALPAEALANGVDFGIAVPLVADFPPDGAMLDEEELLAWLDRLDAAQRLLELRLQGFDMELRAGADGTICGRSNGKLPVQTFVDALGVEDPERIALIESVFGPYAGLDDPELIEARFTFSLEPGRFTSGMPCAPDPCVTTEAMCSPEGLLTTRTTRDRCWLDATGGAPAAVLDATCLERADDRIIEWSIDCAALGADCTVADGCGVDYRTPTPGDLVFTELFIGDGVQQTYDGGPNTIEDQWLELYNAADSTLDVDGCVLRSGPIDGFRQAVLQPAGPVPVAPGERIVLVYADDLALNGLPSSAYAYGWPVGLGRADGGDRVALYCDDALIDEVRWADGWGIDADAASMQLDAGTLDAAGNDALGSWCASAGDPFSEGRLGSPGAPNAPCP